MSDQDELSPGQEAQQATEPKRRPYAGKPTKEEHRKRVEQCRKMIVVGWHDGEIKRAMAGLHKISPRSVERYLRRAREILVRDAGKTKEQHVAESYAFYLSIIRSDDAGAKEKILARKRIDELLGLDAPKQIAPVSPDGKQAYGVHVMQEIMRVSEELGCKDGRSTVEVIDVDFVQRLADETAAQLGIEYKPEGEGDDDGQREQHVDR